MFEQTIESALTFAAERHAGQLYNNLPYDQGHLVPVMGVLSDFGFTDYVRQASAALHDVVEDDQPRTTISEVRRYFGDMVADDCWAVTGIGETRRERNLCIYEKLVERPRAAILKCADRIVNVEHSNAADRYVQMYWKEQLSFQTYVQLHVPPEMWNRLITAFETRL